MLTTRHSVICQSWLTNRWRGLTMKEIAVCEAEMRLSELLAEVESGEQFVITRRGVAVARLVAAAPAAARRAQGNAQRERVNQAFAELAQLRSGTVLDVPLKDAIDHGRD